MNIICMVLDSFGIGNAPDSESYNDFGSNTYKAIADDIFIPNLKKLGLNNIDGVDFAEPSKSPLASFGRLIEKSCGKDTTIGHFEMMQVITTTPFPTYPNGFPADVINMLQSAWNTSIIGNVAASGTQIINELGDKHCATKFPIIYTSADSVLQIACNEDIYPIKTLYEMCTAARKLLVGKHCVARVIARPFKKSADGTYYRTSNRKDFGITPPTPSTLNVLQNRGVQTIGIGKIFDIFSGNGIDKNVVAHSNEEVITATINQISTVCNSFIFSNLVDFDMLYGHRNDVLGYKNCLQQFDMRLPEIIKSLNDDDILILTADHGCDPSTPSTDHSRECVPLLIYSKNLTTKNFGTIVGFDFVGKFILEKFV